MAEQQESRHCDGRRTSEELVWDLYSKMPLSRLKSIRDGMLKAGFSLSIPEANALDYYIQEKTQLF